MPSILEEQGFAAAVIDALASHICVLNAAGVIVAVNSAWRNFARENPPVPDRCGVGADYLDVCQNASGPGSEEAAEFADGVKSVLQGRSDLFEMEYPCHSPTQNRWFLGRATPLKARGGGAVISHMTITDRKLLELHLARLAATDALTGVPNRRFFMAAGDQEVARLRRFGVPSTVIMIDLDHFKEINDRFGHAAGDEVLRSLAQMCRRSLREVDVFARIGGEEFVVMLPGTDETGGAKVADKLRVAVRESTVRHDQDLIKMTASFGVAEVWPSDQGVDESLARADLALYAAKRSGRDYVTRFAAIPHEA